MARFNRRGRSSRRSFKKNYSSPRGRRRKVKSQYVRVSRGGIRM